MNVLTCPRTGKIAHPSMRLAKRALRSLGKSGIEKTAKPYRCPFCGAYHLGNPKPIGRPA